MRRFQLEHIGIAVTDPMAAAEWYRRVLGFEVLHTAGGPESANAFVRSENGTVLEFWRQEDQPSTADELSDPLQLHVAFKSENPTDDAKYLVDEGATLFQLAAPASNGDSTVALRDPWGNCIQLAKRGANSFFRR